ncbi:MAG: hypothetical protein ABI127_07210 [Dokdonella sp.]
MHLRSRTRRSTLAGMSLVAFTTASIGLASTPVEHSTGTAYDAKGRALYTETHWSTVDGGETRRLVLFTCADGKPFARKQVNDAGQPLAPLFALDDARFGYREGVRLAADGKREVFVRRNSGQSEQSAPVEVVPRLVVDAGFDRFIIQHWDALVGGHEQKLEFLLPSRLRTYSFVLKPAGADQIDGMPVQRFRLELDSWFGFALPSIHMAYASDTRVLREYSGISNIRDNDGKSLKVRIAFPPTARSEDADAQSMGAAEVARLDGQCRL